MPNVLTLKWSSIDLENFSFYPRWLFVYLNLSQCLPYLVSIYSRYQYFHGQKMADSVDFWSLCYRYIRKQFMFSYAYRNTNSL